MFRLAARLVCINSVRTLLLVVARWKRPTFKCGIKQQKVSLKTSRGSVVRKLMDALAFVVIRFRATLSGARQIFLREDYPAGPPMCYVRPSPGEHSSLASRSQGAVLTDKKSLSAVG